jgi:hypothetical protein
MPDAGFPQERSDWSWKTCDVASSTRKKDWIPAYAHCCPLKILYNVLWALVVVGLVVIFICLDLKNAKLKRFFLGWL